MGWPRLLSEKPGLAIREQGQGRRQLGVGAPRVLDGPSFFGRPRQAYPGSQSRRNIHTSLSSTDDFPRHISTCCDSLTHQSLLNWLPYTLLYGVWGD